MAEKLSEKQKRFADEYLKTGNATDASIRAGYSPKYAGQNADKLLKNTKIADYIKKRNEQVDRQNIADIEEVKAFWTDTMRNEQEYMKDRLRASENLAKTAGAFIERNILQADTRPVSGVIKEIENYFESIKFDDD